MEPFIIILIIWLISSAFSGFSNQQKSKPTTTTPPIPVPPEHRRSRQPTVQKKPKPVVIKQPVDKPKPFEMHQPNNDVKPFTKPNLQTIPVLDEMGEQVPVSRKEVLENEIEKLEMDFQKQIKTSANFKTSLTRKRVVDGVIWAEILGPPRAKNPFFRK